MSILTISNKTADLRRKVKTDDSRGGWTEVYSTFATVRGRIQPKRGMEFLSRDRKVWSVTHVFYAVWSSAAASLVPPDRLRIEGTEYDVLAVRDIDKMKRLVTVDMKEVR